MLKGKYQFEVKWWPFQLNPASPMEPVSKLEMYMKKFNMSQEQCMAMATKMSGNFKAVGLPFAFSEKGRTGNTINAHRLVTYAGAKHGLAVQDKVMEELFHSYFAEEKFPGDKAVLLASAIKGGIPESEAKALVDDEKQFLAETKEEFKYGEQMRYFGLTGVPFFVFSVEGGKEKEYICGAYPAKEIVEHIQQMVENNE